jgi:hypothetical protein
VSVSVFVSVSVSVSVPVSVSVSVSVPVSVSVSVCVLTYRADITVFFEYADIDGSGGLDAGELQETQTSLNVNVLSSDQAKAFILTCGAEVMADFFCGGGSV